MKTYADIATTYPNPKLGDTVQTIDDSKIYRWDGTQWIWTQQYNANAITDVQNKIGILSTADDVLFQNDRSIFLEIDKYKKLRFHYFPDWKLSELAPEWGIRAQPVTVICFNLHIYYTYYGNLS